MKLALLIFLAAAFSPALAQTGAPGNDVLARGEYLARAADCAVCHTAPGGKNYAGGRAFDLPFGTLYSPNITADTETGIGNYTDDDFVSAVTRGVAPAGKHLYPAMPYPSYARMTREDALAIKAYLFSLPAERAPQTEDKLEFPFNQRWGMIAWNVVFRPSSPFRADPNMSPAWNRGAYLVEVLGHCGECHTPRGILQNMKNGERFGGALTQGWMAYNLTADRTSGIGAWTEEALASYLATGHAEGRSSAAGPMAEVVENSTRFLTRDDIRAMVTYLRSVAPIGNAFPVEANPPARQDRIAGEEGSLGERIFAGECANCHRFDGSGAQTAHASLVGNRTVNDPKGTNLVRVVLEGVHLNGLISMPAFGRGHTDDEIAAVANFVNGTFGNGALKLTAADIDDIRNPPMEFIPAWVVYVAAGAAALLALVILSLILRFFVRRRRALRPA
jgi:mono/diheme cytochrome c family protein